MLIGSLVVHLLILLVLALRAPIPELPPQATAPDQVAMVYQSAGDKQASTAAPEPSQQASVARGNADAPVAPPTPDTSLPTPPQPDAPPTPPPTGAPPEPSPEQPPAPTPDPAPTPTPPAAQPPTVSLDPEEEGFTLQSPAFRMPQPPLPLPPLPLPPRPAPPPRYAARPVPRSPHGFPVPQQWSFNAPAQPPGHASHGFDMGTSNSGGMKDTSLGYISGARPSGDWMSELRRWVDARTYYPEQAIADEQQGDATLMLLIDRSGRVLSAKIIETSRSPFLDGAWLDIFRGASVPPFTPDMTEQTTTMRATLRYMLRIIH